MEDSKPDNNAGLDAEAVLAALSGRLQWRDMRNVKPIDGRLYFSQHTTEVSSYGIQWYAIWQGTEDKPFIACLESEIGPTMKGPTYTTLGAAQAACERHYATRRWE